MYKVFTLAPIISKRSYPYKDLSASFKNGTTGKMHVPKDGYAISLKLTGNYLVDLDNNIVARRQTELEFRIWRKAVRYFLFLPYYMPTNILFPMLSCT